MDQLVTTVEDGVCLLRIDRPERLNALDDSVMDGMLRAFSMVADSPTIGAVVLTGTGRAFSAGADIGLLDGLATPAQAAAYIERIRDVYVAIESCPRPVIAAVNGLALGGGTELCLASDLVIAGDSAAFALPEIRLGAIPGFATIRLGQVVGRVRAAELMLLGDRIDAQRAFEIGLVNRVVPADRVVDEALALGRRIAAGPPLATTAIKRALRSATAGADLELFTSSAAAVLASDDAREGMRAFRAKEEPRFSGR